MVMTVTQRDVKRIAEQEDFAQQAARVLEELRWRNGVGQTTQERAKEAAEAFIEAYGKARALRGRIEADEDVRL